MERPCAQGAVLHESLDGTVLLMDLPLSIASAQLRLGETLRSMLMSVPALDAAHASTEPKSEKAWHRVHALRGGNVDKDHRDLIDFVRHNLAKITSDYGGRWCLPRRVCNALTTADPAQQASRGSTPCVNDFQLALKDHLNQRAKRSPGPLDLKQSQNAYEALDQVARRIVVNRQSGSAIIHSTGTGAIYRIPANAVFCLDTIDHRSADVWSLATKRVLSFPTASAAPGQFDFVLLDPPWSNKSVSRSRSYRTDHGGTPLAALIDVLGQHVAPHGHVACWVTNSVASFEAAQEAFAAWGLQIIEEWVWIKVTSQGSPTYDLEGIWRRPYERLLVGRKVDEYEQGDFSSQLAVQVPVKRRLIACVPDLHSRKPCIKSLVERLVPDTADYRALEIFARHLTAGWWAWGDEVLKFNEESHWYDIGELDDACN